MLSKVKSNKSLIDQNNKQVKQIPIQQIEKQRKKQISLKSQETIYDKLNFLEERGDNLISKVISIQQQISKYSETQYKQMKYYSFNFNQSPKYSQKYNFESPVSKKHQDQIKKMNKIGNQKVEMIFQLQKNIKQIQNSGEIKDLSPQKILKQKHQLQSKFKKYYDQRKLINKSKSERFQLLDGQIVSRTFNKMQMLGIQNNIKRSQQTTQTQINQNQSNSVLQLQNIQKQFQDYRERTSRQFALYEEELNQCFHKQQLLIRQVQKLKYEHLSQKILKSSKANKNDKSENLQKFKTQLNIKFVEQNKNKQELQQLQMIIKELEETNQKLRNDITLKECQQNNRLKRQLKQKQSLLTYQMSRAQKMSSQNQQLFKQIEEMNMYIFQCKEKLNLQNQIIDQQKLQIQKYKQSALKAINQSKLLLKKLNVVNDRQKQLKELNRKMLKDKQEKRIQYFSKLQAMKIQYQKKREQSLRLKKQVPDCKKYNKCLICSKVFEFSHININKPKTKEEIIQIIPQLNLQLNFQKQKTKMLTTRHPSRKQTPQFQIDKFQNVRKHNNQLTLKKLIDVKFSSKQDVSINSEQIELKINLALKLIKFGMRVIQSKNSMKSQAKLNNKKLQSLRPDKLYLTYKNETISIQSTSFMFQHLEDKLALMKSDIQNVEFIQKQYNQEETSNQKNLVYLSPEVLLGMNQFQFSYCWTIGIIIDQIFHHKIYYHRIEQIIAHKNNYKFDQSLNLSNEDQTKLDKVKNLLQKILVKNYKQRKSLASAQQQFVKILKS